MYVFTRANYAVFSSTWVYAHGVRTYSRFVMHTCEITYLTCKHVTWAYNMANIIFSHIALPVVQLRCWLSPLIMCLQYFVTTLSKYAHRVWTWKANLQPIVRECMWVYKLSSNALFGSLSQGWANMALWKAKQSSWLWLWFCLKWIVHNEHVNNACSLYPSEFQIQAISHTQHQTIISRSFWWHYHIVLCILTWRYFQNSNTNSQFEGREHEDASPLQHTQRRMGSNWPFTSFCCD